MTPDPSPPDGPVPEVLKIIERMRRFANTSDDGHVIDTWADELEDALKAAAAPSSPLPQLKWEGPNDDGDLLVTLMGVEKMHLTVHGKTIGEALHMLGDVLEGAFMNDCPDPEAHTAPSSPPLAGSASSSTEGLSFETFSRVNRQRCESPDGFNHALASWSTSDWFLAVLGELGEAANIAKKLNRVRDGIPGNKETADALRDKLRCELGDAFVYLDLLAQSLGLSIGAAAVEVFNAKSDQLGCPIRLVVGRPSPLRTTDAPADKE